MLGTMKTSLIFLKSDIYNEFYFRRTHKAIDNLENANGSL